MSNSSDAQWVLNFLTSLEGNENRHAPVETMQRVMAASESLIEGHKSVIEWCQPEAPVMPDDQTARLEWYARRLVLIANAARSALQKAGVSDQEDRADN